MNCPFFFSLRPVLVLLVQFHALLHSLVPVQLVFRGVSYPNNSVLSLNDIGEFSTGSAILCTTNRSPCCSSSDSTMRFGQWYYPDGSMVPNSGQDFNRSRRDNQTIYLNRRNNAQSPTGSFCCELPDNSSVTHRVCVSLCKFRLLQIFTGFSNCCTKYIVFHLVFCKTLWRLFVSVNLFMLCFLFHTDSHSGCCKHSLGI